ncbi:MAG: hypothetical protein FJ308_17605 [Planctomycetes bacterium]|nr:hypothetical protein [Planctomycetota bacterium]
MNAGINDFRERLDSVIEGSSDFEVTKLSVREVAAYLGVMLIAILFRCIGLFGRSFSGDEVYELRHLSLDLFEIARDPDGFPPLFRWLVSAWVAAFGVDGSRLVSVFFGVVAVISIMGIAHFLGGMRAGIAAGVWSAVSAHQIEFSQSLRSYSIFIAFSAMAILAALHLIRRPDWKHWLLFLLASGLCFSTHYYAVYLLFALWVYVVWRLWDRPIGWIVGAAIQFIFCLPTLICLRIDLTVPIPPEVVNPVDLTGLAYLYWTLLVGWCVGPSAIQLQVLGAKNGILAMLPWLLPAGLAVLVIANSALRSADRYRWAFLVIILFTLPWLAGFVAANTETSFVARYLAFLAVPLGAVIGCAFAGSRKRYEFLAFLFLIGLNLLSTYHRTFDSVYATEDYRSLVRFIESRSKDPIIISMSHYMSYAFERETPKEWKVYAIAFGSDEPDDWKEVLMPLLENISEDQQLYLVVPWVKDPSIRIEQREQMVRWMDAKLLPAGGFTEELYEGTAAGVKRAFLEKKATSQGP